MHIIIKRFLVNEQNHLILEDKIKGDHFCLEIQFISINNDFVIQAEKIFEKYQIKINQYLDSNYIFNFLIIMTHHTWLIKFNVDTTSMKYC